MTLRRLGIERRIALNYLLATYDSNPADIDINLAIREVQQQIRYRNMKITEELSHVPATDGQRMASESMISHRLKHQEVDKYIILALKKNKSWLGKVLK